QAAISGFALLFGFAFLPLWQLKSVPSLRVIRRELGAPDARAGLLYLSGGAVLCALFLWQAGSVKLGLTVLGGLAAGLIVFGFLAWLLVRALSRLGVHAFSNLARHSRGNAMQIVALSLGGMALLLLTFVRADLLESWQERLPPDMPNHFIVNIQPEQRDAVRDFFTQQRLPVPNLFPMVRGRLVEINGQPVSGESYADSRARGLVEREFNLSWSDEMPAHDELARGKWWKKNDASALSVEEGLAKTLDIHMGDVLTYDVAGERFSAPVTNFRKVEWDSMQVNFFVITTRDLLEDQPASYITSFHLPPDKRQAANALIKTFPNLLLIDVGEMIEQVRNIMDQIARTMSVVFLFTLASGLAVLYAALLATQDERVHQTAILRTLGADSRYLRRLHLAEFATLGALSGLFAVAGAVLLGWILAREVLDIPYHPGIAIWPVGIGGGAAIVALAGWLATRRTVRMSPLRVLQEI
ncbi:MAG: ABC transporter permease, partial [Gallionellaceae bacterium]|nr:ABC transporter permease [Gallionellaceae bacterium]